MKNQLEFNKLVEEGNLNERLTNELSIDKKLRFEIGKSNQSESILSKLGGFPDLSTEINYPTKDSHYYEFVVQINLNELSAESILPKEGLLSFFILDDTYRSDVPNKVIYQNSIRSLGSKKPPMGYSSNCESFESRNESKAVKLNFEPSISINETLMQQVYDQTKNEEVFTSFSSTNQILGDEIGWRDPDYKWKAYLSKKGLKYIVPFVQHYKIAKYEGNNLATIENLKTEISTKIKELKAILIKYGPENYMYKYWKENLEGLINNLDSIDDIVLNYEQHKYESKNWIHLLGLYSDSNAALSFGDGKMQFFIHLEDLKKMCFENIYCDICN